MRNLPVSYPTITLAVPVVSVVPALTPTAVLVPPVVKEVRARYPTAVLLAPELYGAEVVPPFPAEPPTNVL